MSDAVNFDSVFCQLIDYGLAVIRSDIVIGVRRRCRVKDGGLEKRGWFHLFEVPCQSGSGTLIVGSYGAFWAAESYVQKIRVEKDQLGTLSKEQREALRLRLAEDARRRAADEKRRHDKAAAEATIVWRKCRATGSSAYLDRKCVKPYGVRFSPSGAMAIPILDAYRRVHGLQIIRPDKSRGREKEFFPEGMSVKGHFHLIGNPGRVVLLTEGYATGATLHEATGLPIAVAFAANNLLPVATEIRKKWPRSKILIAADDDYLQRCKECRTLTPVAEVSCRSCGKPHKQSIPGVDYASAAALAVDGSWLTPSFSDDRPTDRKGPTDFNDLHLLEGLHVVAKQVLDHLAGLKWPTDPTSTAAEALPTGGGERRRACSVMDLDDIVSRFVPIDDGTGDAVFDFWTNKIVDRSQMMALLPAGMRGDDIKRHPTWITRGAYYIDQIGFDPAGTDSAIQLNTWQGWPIKPRAGCCDRLLELIEYLCSQDSNARESIEWLLNWMAYPLQHPGAKMDSAVIMHGPQGTGKTTVFRVLSKIYGDYATVLNQRGLEDKFNADWAYNKLLIIAEEVVNRAEMWHIKNELKELVTGEWIRINPKHIGAHRQVNHLQIVFLSNENQPLPIENDDRRHLVIYTPGELSEEFYDELFIEIENGGVEAFYDYLLHRDLSRFHPKKRPPMTDAKQALIALSLPSDHRFLVDWIAGDLDLPVVPCLSTDIYAAYLRWCRENGESRPRASNQFFSTLSHLPGWDKRKKRVYLSDTSTDNSPLPIVTPPSDVLSKHSCIEPIGDDGKKCQWLSKHVRRFRASLRGNAAEMGDQ